MAAGPLPRDVVEHALGLHGDPSVVPLSTSDTAAIVEQIGALQDEGRVVGAIEVHPSRRRAGGHWHILGADLYSNGLIPRDRFNLKVQGTVFEWVDRSFLFPPPRTLADAGGELNRAVSNLGRAMAETPPVRQILRARDWLRRRIGRRR